MPVDLSAGHRVFNFGVAYAPLLRFNSLPDSDATPDTDHLARRHTKELRRGTDLDRNVGLALQTLGWQFLSSAFARLADAGRICSALPYGGAE